MFDLRQSWVSFKSVWASLNLILASRDSVYKDSTLKAKAKAKDTTINDKYNNWWSNVTNTKPDFI